MPWVALRGCAFHWRQCIFRKIQALGLYTSYLHDEATHNYCKLLMALPFLPAEHISAMFSYLENKAATPPLKIVFWLYLGAILADQRQIWKGDEGSHADLGRVTKTAIFANSRWRTDAILKIVFLAISRRHIGRLTWNLEQRWRITCRYTSRDQNCNFRRFKMADGRHFENSFISISQPWIIRFRSNLVHRYKFSFRACPFDKKNRNFSNSRWRTDAILKIVFWLYLGSILAD